MFEKYNVEHLGQPGVGGEYIVQEGFGWTNGVIFALVRMFPKQLSLNPALKDTCAPPTVTINEVATMGKSSFKFIFIVVAVLGFLACLAGIYFYYQRTNRMQRVYSNLNDPPFQNSNQ